MPKADYIKALISSYAEADEAQFFSIAMQIAAAEARAGHGKAAKEIKDLVAKSRGRISGTQGTGRPIPLARPKGELADLLSVSYPKTKLTDMVFDKPVETQLTRVVEEHKAISRIRTHGLSPRRKLLLVGAPGTGKTLTASALAGELGLPLFVVRLDGLITKFMGETSAKLRLIFEAMTRTRGVFLFDEFDSIGSGRDLGNDVGEIRRVVNSFLQMVEQDQSDSLIIAATNHARLLDRALFRRFDDMITYELPNAEQIRLLLRAKLGNFKRVGRFRWSEVATKAVGLSYADIVKAAEDTIKSAIIDERDVITSDDLLSSINQRLTTAGDNNAE